MEISKKRKAARDLRAFIKGGVWWNKFLIGEVSLFFLRGSKEDEMFKTLVVCCEGAACIACACTFVLLDRKRTTLPWQWGGGEHGTMTMDLPHLLQRRNQKLHSKLYFFFLHDTYLFFVPSFGCPIQNATHFTVEVGSRRYSLLCELVVLAEMSCIVIICIIASILSRQLFDAEGFNKILSFRLSTIPNYCSKHDIFGEWFQPSNLIPRLLRKLRNRPALLETFTFFAISLIMVCQYIANLMRPVEAWKSSGGSWLIWWTL